MYKYLIILILFNVSASTELIYKDHVLLKSNGLHKLLRTNFSYGHFKRFYKSDYHFSQIVDQVFVSGKSKIFVKSGLEVERENREKFLRSGTDLMYHFSMRGKHFAILFEDVEESHRVEFIKSLKRFINKQKAKRFSLLESIIPQAKASENVGVDCNEELTPLSVASIESLQAPAKKSHMSYLMNQAMGCVQSALAGAWSSTGGLVKDVGSSVFSFLRSPIKSSQRLWKSAKDTYSATKKFITNMQSEVSSMVGAVSDLSLESQLAIICNLVGSLGTRVLIGTITGGPVGLAAALAMLGKKASRIKNLVSSLKILDKFKGSFSSAKEHGALIKGILMSTNKAALDRLKSLGNAKMDKLTMRYAQCAF